MKYVLLRNKFIKKKHKKKKINIFFVKINIMKSLYNTEKFSDLYKK